MPANDTALDYLHHTRAWTSSVGEGPSLRGRRAESGGPLLHFLHGNGFCGGVYWPFLSRFLPDYALFCHDFEGHGHSDAPQRFSGPRALIQRIPQVMAEQGLTPERPLIGIGHSYGAALTLRVAAENPGLFRALVMLDPIAMPTSAWLGVKLAAALRRNPIAQAARRRRDRWASRAEVLERLSGRGIYAGWTELALHCFVEHATRDDEDGTRVLCCPKSLEAEIFDQPIYPWRAFPTVQVPILYLYGTGSYSFIPWAARLAQRANPRVSVQTLDGGHCYMQQDPVAAADAVRAFLKLQGL